MKSLILLIYWISSTNSLKWFNKKISIISFRLKSLNTPEPLPTSRPTLTEKSLWRLSIRLEKQGFSLVEATSRIRFIQARNYEPPQGKIFVQDDYNGLIKVDQNGYAGTWTLSEDRNDRKDGLWICK